MLKTLILLCAAAALLYGLPAHKRKSAAHKKSRQSWRTSQAAPSPQRYKEIQEALAAKGYLQSPATGVWNQDSADALRRFQADQHLDATGKLSARSLIALGLGPKTETPPHP
jgi:peptidoglycan hydrolase-like protein with peptidoglycan-binding domain